jgi:hypothetical protein
MVAGKRISRFKSVYLLRDTNEETYLRYTASLVIRENLTIGPICSIVDARETHLHLLLERHPFSLIVLGSYLRTKNLFAKIPVLPVVL